MTLAIIDLGNKLELSNSKNLKISSSVYTDEQAKNRLISLTILIIILSSVYPFLGPTYRGSSDLHGIMEMVGSLMGILTGLALVTRFYSLGNRFHLLVGCGFFVNGIEDFVHGFLAFGTSRFLTGPASSLNQFIPGTYVTGRLLLGIILILALYEAKLFKPSINYKKETKYFIGIFAIITVILTSIAFVLPLPKFVFPNNLISRPLDFISAIILAIAFVGFFNIFKKKNEKLVYWLMVSIGINIVGQLIMSTSKVLTDSYFDVAHSYKVLGYLTPLLGFTFYQISVLIDSKNMQDILKENEEQTRVIVDTALDAIVTINDNGYIEYINRSFTNIFGYTQLEAIGQKITFIMPETYKPNHISAFSKYINSGKKNKDGFRVQFEGKRRSGEIFPLDLAVSEFYVRNERKFTGLITDQTEKVKAESTIKEKQEKFSTLFDTLYDGVILTDLEGVITEWNIGSERMFGYTKEDAIGKTPALVYYPKESANLTKKIINGIIKDGKWIGEINFIKKDGIKGICETIVIPINNSKGKTIGTVGVNRDITERKLATEQIKLQNESLKSKNEDLLILDKMKTEFVSAASHELRTPLTSIKGSLGLIISGNIPEDQTNDFIEICYNNTNRLIRLVNDFLDLSKLESQSIEFTKGKFDLNVLLMETIVEMEQFAKSNSIKINYEKINNIELYADRDRISQILVNLLSNAIKFSEGKEVSVSANLNSKFVKINIDDTSKIINVSIREKLFEPFVQGEKIMSRKASGTGLGLAICKSIVDQHGGKIWIEENGTKGNRFVFSIPVS